MEFYIKLGKMYVCQISLEKNCYSTEFIDEIKLEADNYYAIKIKEEDKFYLIDKLGNIFGLGDEKYNFITFEEVEKKENEDE